MKTITRKPEIREAANTCLEAYQDQGIDVAVQVLHAELLRHKVKFPLLEYATTLLYEALPEDEQLNFCDQVRQLQTIGGNVILGKMLQQRLPDHYDQSLARAAEYISQADAWYVCDIIGERVFGVALLTQPERTIPEIKKLAKHPSFWVVRSLGAGSHYAIKKGLGANHVEQVFALLFSMANTNHKEIRQGVGWAAKTTAKFHPDIIERYQSQIQDGEKVANWFRTKVKIGLNRNQHARGNRS